MKETKKQNEEIKEVALNQVYYDSLEDEDYDYQFNDVNADYVKIKNPIYGFGNYKCDIYTIEECIKTLNYYYRQIEISKNRIYAEAFSDAITKFAVFYSRLSSYDKKKILMEFTKKFEECSILDTYGEAYPFYIAFDPFVHPMFYLYETCKSYRTCQYCNSEGEYIPN